MPTDIDFDDFAPETRRVLAAAAEDIDTRGYATRGEVSRILAEDYQWARHRLNQLRDAGVLDQSATKADGQVEKRYTLADEYRETAETVREALAVTGGDLPDDPGADEFYQVIDEVRELKDRLDEEGAADGDVVDRIDELESQMPRQDVDERLDRLAQRVSEFERYIQNN